MPMDRRLYPDDWEAIALALKEQAGWKCQECGRPCRKPSETLGQLYQRIGSEHWRWADDLEGEDSEGEPTLKLGRFTLTVAHPNHDPQNPNAELRAWCSVCHLRHDTKQIATKRRLKRERLGQLTLAIEEDSK